MCLKLKDEVKIPMIFSSDFVFLQLAILLLRKFDFRLSSEII